MSRASEQQIGATAGADSAEDTKNAQDAYNAAQGSVATQQTDINNFGNQLSTFAAANPYGAGGAYQTAVNQSTANTADAASESAKQAAAAAAVRTGQNASEAVSAGQATDQANARSLMATQAGANEKRIGSGADYGSKVLSASEIPATLQAGLTGEESKLTATEADAGNQALGVQQKAEDEPNFLDTLGTSFAAGLGKFSGGGR